MKPKIIGLITAWYAEKWIAAAVEQALEYCDEVIVAIGANTKPLAALEDTTYTIVSKYKDKITLIGASMSQTLSLGRANTLNRMLSVSKFRKAGNWVWILDVDEFYFNCAYQKIRKAINSGLYNHIQVEEKNFFINTTRYLICSHRRLFRIKNSDNKFKPTQHWTGPLTKKYTLKRDDKQQGMFHYSYVVNVEYRRLQWETEYQHKQSQKLKWLSEIFVPYDLDNEEFWISKNKKLFGIKSPIYLTEVKPNTDGKFFVYNDRHPPHVETAGITSIKDFRKT